MLAGGGRLAEIRLAHSHRPTVGVRIHAGLGNQMFMYAAALALSERLGARLVCDVQHYRRHRADRSLEFGAFGIRFERGRVPPYRPLRNLASTLHLVRDPFRNAELLHSEEGYDPRFHQINGSCVLTGYFQSWRYFAGFEESVRRAFDPDRLATERTRTLATEIMEADCAVAVHVRRGDYAAWQHNVDKYGLLRRNYYDAGRSAIASIADGRKATYFLFSDDAPAAAAELVGWSGLRPVSGYTGLEDMYLMTRCRHFIIANSTFSWWAAWLGHATDKRVVAPTNWFASYEHAYRTDDRIPPGWLAA